MKVKCILSHEKPMGNLYEAGKIYEMDEYEERFFVPVEEKKEKKDEVVEAQPHTDKEKKGKMYN